MIAMGMIAVDQLMKVGSDHDNLLNNAEKALIAIRALRNKLKPIRVDATTHPETEPEWLAEFDIVCEDAWAACRAVDENVRAERRRGLPAETFMGKVIQVLMAAKETVQADSACNMGVIGCENRWDKALDALRKEVAWVKLS
jgi:hypothetical protein